MRKKVDQRIRMLVENGVKLRQRSMFVIVGDRGRDQARMRIFIKQLALFMRNALVSEPAALLNISHCVCFAAECVRW